MGAAQSIPVVGEALTVVDSAGRTIAAGVCYPFDEEAADKLFKSASKSWEDYADRNVITANARLIYAKITDDEKEVDRLLETQKQAWTSLGENTPVVGHVMASVYALQGDEEAAWRSFNGANRSSLVVLATVATGGAGGPLVAGAVAVGSGVVYDTAQTGIQSAVHDKFEPAGYIAMGARAAATGDVCDIYAVGSSLVGDFAGGALAGQAKAGSVRRGRLPEPFPLAEHSAAARRLSTLTISGSSGAGARRASAVSTASSNLSARSTVSIGSTTTATTLSSNSEASVGRARSFAFNLHEDGEGALLDAGNHRPGSSGSGRANFREPRGVDLTEFRPDSPLMTVPKYHLREYDAGRNNPCVKPFNGGVTDAEKQLFADVRNNYTDLCEVTATSSALAKSTVTSQFVGLYRYIAGRRKLQAGSNARSPLVILGVAEHSDQGNLFKNFQAYTSPVSIAL